MSTIYERLRASERLPGAYEDWSTYREALTDYLCRIIPSDSRILILGAGGCNDLDLNRLLQQGYDITLLDRECSLMEEGLRRQKIKEGRISFLERDVWPIRKELCETLLLKMQQRMSIENLCDTIRQGTKASMQETLEMKSVYDYVIAVGFHSQINSLFPALFQTAIQESTILYQTDKNYTAFLWRKMTGWLTGCSSRSFPLDSILCLAWSIAHLLKTILVVSS